MIEGDEVLAPQMIERLQNDLLFDVPHRVGRIPLHALCIGVRGRRMEPGRYLFVGDALLLRPFVDRQVEVELVDDLILQACGVPASG